MEGMQPWEMLGCCWAQAAGVFGLCQHGWRGL